MAAIGGRRDDGVTADGLQAVAPVTNTGSELPSPLSGGRGAQNQVGAPRPEADHVVAPIASRYSCS
jgi:hypothetical protein